jgi:hypothetical protein
MPKPVPAATKETEGRALAQLFAKVNQAQFSRDHGVPGGASMVSQNISGNRPISMDAALVYSKGLGVDISEFSPRLAKKAAKYAAGERLAVDPPGPTVEAALDTVVRALAGLPDDGQEALAKHLQILAVAPGDPRVKKRVLDLLRGGQE